MSPVLKAVELLRARERERERERLLEQGGEDDEEIEEEPVGTPMIAPPGFAGAADRAPRDQPTPPPSPAGGKGPRVKPGGKPAPAPAVDTPPGAGKKRKSGSVEELVADMS